MSTAPCPTLAEFAAALRDPTRPTPAAVHGIDDVASARRFAVHRNNIAVALATALAASHPVTAALVGEAFFAALAQAFFRAHPPVSPVLATCGQGFASWLEGFPPAAVLPYLADMARLEWAIAEVAQCEAVERVPPAWIEASLQAANVPGHFRVRLQPALRVLGFDHGVVSLWQAHRQDDAALAEVAVDEPEHCLLLPDTDTVAIVPVDAQTAGFVADLVRLAALDEAAQPWLGRPAFDLTRSLGILIRHRIITGWTFEELPA